MKHFLKINFKLNRIFCDAFLTFEWELLFEQLRYLEFYDRQECAGEKELTNGKTLSLMTELRSQKIWKMVQRFQNDNQLKSELQSRADEECHIKYGRNAD